jgi:hypothetical protein
VDYIATLGRNSPALHRIHTSHSPSNRRRSVDQCVALPGGPVYGTAAQRAADNEAQLRREGHEMGHVLLSSRNESGKAQLCRVWLALRVLSAAAAPGALIGQLSALPRAECY